MRTLLACLLLGASSWAQGGPWLYQLQRPNPAGIARSGFSTVVMDYSRTGADGARHRPGQMRKLAGLTTLAYLSIGEAENYRFYWREDWVGRTDSNTFTASAPEWLGHTNPDWRGNYKVRYWDPAWRDEVLRPYLDRILRQGFDGVYLDIVDAFEYWAAPSSYGGSGETYRPGDPRGDEREAARRMIELVRWIADYGRQKAGRGFLVFPQNAENILRHDAGGRYLRAISGIGVEDLFYDETRAQPRREVAYRLKFLRRIAARGKPVLCVDYVDDGSGFTGANAVRIESFVAACEREGFDCYVARSDRELDRIHRIPGVQP